MRSALLTHGPSVLAFLIQATLVSAISLVAARALRARGPAVQVAVYRAGFLSILVLLILGPALQGIVRPWWTISSQTASNRSSVHSAALDASELQSAVEVRPVQNYRAPSTRSTLDIGERPLSPSTSFPMLNPFEIFGLVWVGGATLLIVLIAGGAFWVRRLARSATEPNPPAIAEIFDQLCLRQAITNVRLAVSNRVQSPFVAGIRNIVIFLPSDVSDRFESNQVEAMLAHELAHIHGRDGFWTLLSRICCAVAWPSPFGWILANQMTRAGEELCDRIVLDEGIEPSVYAKCLVRVAETFVARPTERLAGACVVPSKSHLKTRITLMLNKSNSTVLGISKRSRILIGAIALAVAIGSCLIASAPLHGDSTPDATVSAVVDAFNRRDFKAVFSRVEGAKVDEAASALAKLAAGNQGMPFIKVDVEPFTVTGDTATAKIKVHSEITSNGHQNGNLSESHALSEVVKLHRVDGDWKVVGSDTVHGLFADLAGIGKNPAFLDKARAGSTKAVILSNLKQIALGVILFIDDHNDTYSLDQSTLKSKIKVYLKKGDKLWLDPDGKPLDFRFNPALKGHSQVEVEAPANTVLLSLGPKDSLVYYNGMTPIAFTDGHVKFVSKAGLEKISWTTKALP